MNAHDAITLEKQDKVAIITMKDASGLNLFNEEIVRGLARVQDEIDDDKQIRAVVLRSGNDHFSAGVDLAFLKTVNPRFIKDNLVFLQRTFGRWQDLQMPVIVGISGLCYGAGMELILGCDLRIAAEGARFAIPEVRLGLSADQGGTTRLTKLVGLGQAKRLILACDEIDAAEALRIGLVEYLVPAADLDERMLKLAKKIAGMPPAAVRFAKKGINLAHENSTAAGLLFEQAQSTYCFGSEDLAEAVNAFIEKRKPVYKDS
jgi:enoyl-CoA hydratase